MCLQGESCLTPLWSQRISPNPDLSLCCSDAAGRVGPVPALIPPHGSPLLRGHSPPPQPLCLGLKGLQKPLEFSSRATFLRTQATPWEPDCSGEDGALLETLLRHGGDQALQQAPGLARRGAGPPAFFLGSSDEVFPAPSVGFCPRSSRQSPCRMVSSG